MTSTDVVNGEKREPTGQLLMLKLSGINHKVVCPSEDELEIEEGCECPVEGCNKHFKGSSQMQMHLVRHHKGLNLKDVSPSKGSNMSNAVYVCPVSGCSRGKDKERPFPRLGQLKQHYQAVHGKKDNICQKCGKRFALRDQCNRHEAECGQTFKCGTCSDSFRTKNGLYMHIKRKKHKLSEGIKPRKTTASSNSSSRLSDTSNLVKVIPSIIVKQVIQLPKPVTTSTQTSQTSSSFTSLKDSACQTDIDSHYNASTTTQTQTVFNFVDDLNTVHPLHAVQPLTRVSTTHLQQHYDSVTTQTEPNQFPSCLSVDLLSLGTQTMDFTFTQGCQTQLTSSCEFGTQTARYEVPSTTSSDAQCLQYDLNTLGLVDFGTQTTASNCSTSQLTNNSNNCEVNDFGTQTIFLPDLQSMESALNCPVHRDDELHILPPPECMDFGTQTRECEHNTIPSFDFGVQTALDLFNNSDTKDQGCQT